MYQSVIGLSNSHHPMSDHLPASAKEHRGHATIHSKQHFHKFLFFKGMVVILIKHSFAFVSHVVQKKNSPTAQHFQVSQQFSVMAFKRCGIFNFRHKTLTMKVHAIDDNKKFGKKRNMFPQFRGYVENFRGLPKFCLICFTSRNETARRCVDRNLGVAPNRSILFKGTLDNPIAPNRFLPSIS